MIKAKEYKGTIQIYKHTEVIINDTYLITAQYEEGNELFVVDVLGGKQNVYDADTLLEAIEWCLAE